MLLDPNGALLTPGQRTERFDNPALARVASNVGEAFRMLELTVVCVHCGATPKMGNHPSDPQWTMECPCVLRLLVNPNRQA